jgi:predicted RNase H-like HicB family nuclease
MKHRYVLLIEKGKETLQGYFPELPGCTTAGSTKAELLENAREALQLYLEDFAQRGEPFPESSDADDMAVVEVDEHEAEPPRAALVSRKAN